MAFCSYPIDAILCRIFLVLFAGVTGVVPQALDGQDPDEAKASIDFHEYAPDMRRNPSSFDTPPENRSQSPLVFQERFSAPAVVHLMCNQSSF